MNKNSQSQIEGLATLLVLDDEIRKLTNLREFSFFATNETHRLIPYHTAYLWQSKELIDIYILAQSGTAEIDASAPTNQWLKEKINILKSDSKAREIHQIDLLAQSDSEKTSAEKFSSTDYKPEELPQYLLWCPLFNKANVLNGGLIIFRETPFSEAEIKMLQWLIASYQYTWSILIKTSKLPPWKKFREKPYFIMLSIIVLSVLLFPVRLSVLGTATVVPKTPILINAPMQGVIKSFAVTPGQSVKAGQLLVTLDKTDLLSTAEVNRKDYLLTQAKLRATINAGFNKSEATSDIPILQAQLAIDKAHLDYTNELLAKADITSPIAGIVVFDSKEDWINQPVQTGERILIVADPKQVKLKIYLPVADLIKLEVGSNGDFFLYGQLGTLPIRITTLGYNAKLLPNKILAYQLSADFTDPGDNPQLGAQGTARLYGNRVPLIYYLIRRPLQAMRQTLGI